MRRHTAAIAAVDNHCLINTHALRGSCRIHRRIATTINRDTPPELGPLTLIGAAKKAHCIENFSRFAGRYIDFLADVCTDSSENGIEAALFFFGKHVVDAMIQSDLHAHIFNAINFSL